MTFGLPLRGKEALERASLLYPPASFPQTRGKGLDLIAALGILWGAGLRPVPLSCTGSSPAFGLGRDRASRGPGRHVRMLMKVTSCREGVTSPNPGGPAAHPGSPIWTSPSPQKAELLASGDGAANSSYPNGEQLLLHSG